MTKEKVGLVLFWISVIWMIVWVTAAAVIWAPIMRSLTTEEINQTIWAFGGPLNFLYGLSIPLGAIAAGVGILLYSRAKGSTICKVGLGLMFTLSISFVTLVLSIYSAPLFGFGGSLILLSFVGILWLSVKDRNALKDTSTNAADFSLVGYVSMVLAAWYLCAKAAEGFVSGLEGLPTMSMMNILILLAMGWVFLFLSHYKSSQQKG